MKTLVRPLYQSMKLCMASKQLIAVIVRGLSDMFQMYLYKRECNYPTFHMIPPTVLLLKIQERTKTQ